MGERHGRGGEGRPWGKEEDAVREVLGMEEAMEIGGGGQRRGEEVMWEGIRRVIFIEVVYVL